MQDILETMHELQNVVDLIPHSLGRVQSDKYDKTINIYEISSLAELYNKSKKLEPNVKDYVLYRWFILKTSMFDEYVFGKMDNVEVNPNPFDKQYDFKINGAPFDLKSTKMPEQFRANLHLVIRNPLPLIEWFYENQSKETRYAIQPRLFMVYSSDKTPENVNHLRLSMDVKFKAIVTYCAKFDENKLFDYNGVKSDVIFIIEDENGELSIEIGSLNRKI